MLGLSESRSIKPSIPQDLKAGGKRSPEAATPPHTPIQAHYAPKVRL